MSTKGIIENGWYWQNPSVAAPGGLQMYDFPTYDNAVVIFMKLIAIFTHNPFLVMNIFYLLSFPLITLASLYVFRQFNLSYIPALFCGLLYAFLPFHFMRNQTHLILSAYYIIPLGDPRPALAHYGATGSANEKVHFQRGDLHTARNERCLLSILLLLPADGCWSHRCAEVPEFATTGDGRRFRWHSQCNCRHQSVAELHLQIQARRCGSDVARSGGSRRLTD